MQKINPLSRRFVFPYRAPIVPSRSVPDSIGNTKIHHVASSFRCGDATTRRRRLRQRQTPGLHLQRLGNHRKHIEIIMAIFKPFMGNKSSNNTFKSFLEFICFNMVQSNPDLIILKIKISKFHDFCILIIINDYLAYLQLIYCLFIDYLWIKWLIYGLLILFSIN